MYALVFDKKEDAEKAAEWFAENGIHSQVSEVKSDA
jgi:hypothetical protein